MQFRMMDWNELQLFLAVADGGSLTAAARKLRVTQPTASRRLLELEASVGEPLFVRGVEGTRLTSFGERMLEPARRMAEWAGEAERVAARTQTGPRGVVRLTAAPGLAFDFVAPFAGYLREKLPEVQLEVISTVQYLDLARREADLALRFAAPTQRDLVSVASVDFDVAPFGSPSYAARLPKKVALADVDWIGWAPPLDHLSPNPELAALIPGFRPSFASDDFLVQLRAAMAGLGAMFLGKVRHRFSLENPLVELPLPLPPRRGSLHLVCARSALDVPRVRAVADLVARELAAASPVRRRR
ncbi:MAG TPA: LysR family transcriptional regulator [Polyangiaceae bacterium]|nr:LysR family transcriptional regulator [Polyangiaceae bacterium]